MGGTGTAEDEGVRLVHTEMAPRCYLSQARCRSNRRRWDECDGNANRNSRVRVWLPAAKCWDPAPTLGTALELEGWREYEHWDLMLPLSFQVSM